MKNVFLVLTLIFSVAFSVDTQAQTACTPAQIEACKKQCTPAQAAACQKVCEKSKNSAASTNAVKVVNTTNDKKASCKKTCSTTKTTTTSNTNVNVSPAKLVGLETVYSSEKKKTQCAKPCVKKTEAVEN